MEPAPALARVEHAGLSADDVRRVVREELAARDRDAEGFGSAGRPPEPAGEPEPKAPAQEAATTRANEVLASALARRQWTDSDAAALRVHFFQMTGDDQTEVLRVFSQAVNQGRLSVETNQVPF